MRNDREQVTVLRKSGMSYSDIAQRMSIPRSTLSSWFKGEAWSNDIAKKCAKRSQNAGAMRLVVMNTVRGNRLRKVYEDAMQDAFVDYTDLKFHPLFISGIMLYTSHGDRTDSPRVRFSSSDFNTISIFNLFLKRVCNVKKIRYQLVVRQNMANNNDIFGIWEEKCSISRADFVKTSINSQKTRSNKPYFGVCNIIVNSAYLKNKILKWVSLLSEDLIKEKHLEHKEEFEK